jgi:hypothetical protein
MYLPLRVFTDKFSTIHFMSIVAEKFISSVIFLVKSCRRKLTVFRVFTQTCLTGF